MFGCPPHMAIEAKAANLFRAGKEPESISGSKFAKALDPYRSRGPQAIGPNAKLTGQQKAERRRSGAFCCPVERHVGRHWSTIPADYLITANQAAAALTSEAIAEITATSQRRCSRMCRSGSKYSAL